MMRAAVLAACALLAGCAAAPAQPLVAGPATHPWGIAKCAFVIAAIPADEAKLAARLPAGFALAPGRLAALPAGPRGTLELDAYRCERGVGLDGANLSQVTYGSHYVTVTPPADLKESGYDAYFVKLDFLAPDKAHRALLIDAGLPAHDGDAVVDISGPSVSATLTFADGGGFSVTGTIQPPSPAGAPLPFMEFTPLAGSTDLARWHARLHDASIGSGTGIVTLAPGTWPRDAAGADQVPASIIAGEWNLDQADVTFPVAR